MEKQGVLLTLTGAEYAALVIPDEVESKQAWDQNGWVLVKLTGEGLPGPYVESWTEYRAGHLTVDGLVECD